MANIGSKGIVRYEETFATDSIAGGSAGGDGSAADGIAWLGSADTGDTPFVRAMAAARGLHIAGATDTTDDDLVEFCGDQLMFYAQTGHSSIEILVQFDVVSTLAFNFGFNDDVLETSTTLPVELSGTTWTTNAATFVGFVYDVDATNDELHAMWVDGNTDATDAIATLRFNGMAPTASEWLYMKIDLDDRGSGYGARATFLAVDSQGRSVEKVFNTTITRSTALCYYFGFENRGSAAHNCYIKLPAWEQGN